MKIVFLGSGGGGNLKFIYRLSKTDSTFNIVGVVVDRACGASEFAESNNIYTIKHSFVRSSVENEKLISILDKISPDIIITNVHKILSVSVVKKFRGKLINLHYSYLPAYGGLIGMKPVDAAVSRGNKYIGVTCHEVNDKVDDGKTLAQGLFFVSDSTNIYQSTFEIGALSLLAALQFKLGLKVLVKSNFENSITLPGIINFSPDYLRDVFNHLKKE